jgi:2-polyprenyl-6-methoxyphenol hydroxylase-like FAD-dependent oxidoreductase
MEIAALPFMPALTITSPLERKRTLFWGNTIRNKTIAAIAQAFARGDLPALWQHGLLLHAPETIFERFDNQPRTAILVESAEHGRALSQLLPDWGLCTCATDAPVDRPWHGDRAIVTSVWAHKHRLRANVVIRADGTASSWSHQWGPHGDRPCYHSADNPLVIVDMHDDQDEQALSDTHRRLADYRRRGWDVPATPEDRQRRPHNAYACPIA